MRFQTQKPVRCRWPAQQRAETPGRTYYCALLVFLAAASVLLRVSNAESCGSAYCDTGWTLSSSTGKCEVDANPVCTSGFTLQSTSADCRQPSMKVCETPANFIWTLLQPKTCFSPHLGCEPGISYLGLTQFGWQVVKTPVAVPAFGPADCPPDTTYAQVYLFEEAPVLSPSCYADAVTGISCPFGSTTVSSQIMYCRCLTDAVQTCPNGGTLDADLGVCILPIVYECPPDSKLTSPTSKICAKDANPGITCSPTQTATASGTAPPSISGSITATESETGASTPSSTNSGTAAVTGTPSNTAASTPSNSGTSAASQSPSGAVTPSNSGTSAASQSPSGAATPSNSGTSAASQSPSGAATPSNSGTAGATESPSGAFTPSSSMGASPSSSASSLPSPSSSSSSSSSSTVALVPAAAASISPFPSATEAPVSPSLSPVAGSAESSSPSSSPSSTATSSPSVSMSKKAGGTSSTRGGGGGSGSSGTIVTGVDGGAAGGTGDGSSSSTTTTSSSGGGSTGSGALVDGAGDATGTTGSATGNANGDSSNSACSDTWCLPVAVSLGVVSFLACCCIAAGIWYLRKKKQRRQHQLVAEKAGALRRRQGSVAAVIIGRGAFDGGFTGGTKDKATSAQQQLNLIGRDAKAGPLPLLKTASRSAVRGFLHHSALPGGLGSGTTALDNGTNALKAKSKFIPLAPTVLQSPGNTTVNPMVFTGFEDGSDDNNGQGFVLRPIAQSDSSGALRVGAASKNDRVTTSRPAGNLHTGGTIKSGPKAGGVPTTPSDGYGFQALRAKTNPLKHLKARTATAIPGDDDASDGRRARVQRASGAALGERDWRERRGSDEGTMWAPLRPRGGAESLRTPSGREFVAAIERTLSSQHY